MIVLRGLNDPQGNPFRLCFRSLRECAIGLKKCFLSLGCFRLENFKTDIFFEGPGHGGWTVPGFFPLEDRRVGHTKPPGKPLQGHGKHVTHEANFVSGQAHRLESNGLQEAACQPVVVNIRRPRPSDSDHGHIHEGDGKAKPQVDKPAPNPSFANLSHLLLSLISSVAPFPVRLVDARGNRAGLVRVWVHAVAEGVGALSVFGLFRPLFDRHARSLGDAASGLFRIRPPTGSSPGPAPSQVP